MSVFPFEHLSHSTNSVSAIPVWGSGCPPADPALINETLIRDNSECLRARTLVLCNNPSMLS